MAPNRNHAYQPMKTLLRQGGLALPVMLLMLMTMMLTSIYLLKSINSTTMTVSNAAYESALSKSADLGLHTGFQWLSTLTGAAKAQLNQSVPAQAYNASFDTTLTPADDDFWQNAVWVTNPSDASTRVQYVIHRLCSLAGSYDAIGPPANTCVQTSQAATSGTAIPIGASQVGDSPDFAGAPQVHYVITSRITGPRGGNVVNQLVVLIGV